jgi:hypothetical protein
MEDSVISITVQAVHKSEGTTVTVRSDGRYKFSDWSIASHEWSFWKYEKDNFYFRHPSYMHVSEWLPFKSEASHVQVKDLIASVLLEAILLGED